MQKNIYALRKISQAKTFKYNTKIKIWFRKIVISLKCPSNLSFVLKQKHTAATYKAQELFLINFFVVVGEENIFSETKK